MMFILVFHISVNLIYIGTVKHFEDWYASQEKYRKFVDLEPDERERILQQHSDDVVGKKLRKKYMKQTDKARLKTKNVFTINETAEIMAISASAVKRLIQTGRLSAKPFGKQLKIPKEDILWLMTREEAKRAGGI